MRECIDYYMFDFENAGPPEQMSAWQMGYSGEGKDVVVTDPRGDKVFWKNVLRIF